MKTFKKAAMLIVLAIAGAISFNCSSDSNSSASTNFYLKCKVNGTWVEFADPMVINSLAKSITGNNADNGKVVTLFTPLNVATGTFTITDEPSNVNSYAGSFSDFNEEVYTDNETGTMVITEVNANVIKGTFSFTGDDGNGGTITVTEGSFRAENIE
ncbi:hypothetical protein IVB69_07280 [Flavobacterium sp. J49]|uniref:DUF6252 family protein n=1 Tax=Flavobacterium sp. J49 TaxID=2718534 RepID=UPI0015937D42|nr:DUF6252 family protein [Flavobacterium sp. J49]MBF6641277.1 hypothetical protein [Flavobacterium sp. J49]NIC02524.1 hypothetical protein [Flavobacterium sp. J49]